MCMNTCTVLCTHRHSNVIFCIWKCVSNASHHLYGILVFKHFQFEVPDLFLFYFCYRCGLMLPTRFSTLWEQDLGCSLPLPVITNLTTTVTGTNLLCVSDFQQLKTSPRQHYILLSLCSWPSEAMLICSSDSDDQVLAGQIKCRSGRLAR